MPKVQKPNSSANKYFAYLVEIRKRLLFVISLFIVASIIGFIYYQNVVSLILNYFSFKGVNIVFTNPFQFFTLALNTGLAIAVTIILPVIIYQVLSFLKPALKPKEYTRIIILLPLAMLLFIGGFIYGVVMMKYVVQIFYQASRALSIGNMVDVEKFLSSVIITGLLMGVAFLFPIVMSILMQLGVVKYRVFAHQRPIIYIIFTIFVLLLPPPDILSDVVLFTPLVILFELTLILNRVFFKTHLL
jgi:sec-independent protein translocase protein TatC